MRYFWSFFFIAFGLAILGSGLGWWNNNVIWQLLRFWPLILIFLGLELITNGTKLQPVIMLIALVLAGFFVYDAVFSDKPLLDLGARKEISGQVTDTKIVADLPSGAVSSIVKVNTGAVDFKVSGSTDKLIDGNLVSNISSPSLETSVSDNIAKAVLSTDGHPNFWFGMGGFRNELKLSLNKTLPLDFAVDSGASSLDFDLSSQKLQSLTVKTGASSMVIKLGSETLNGAKVLIEAGASSLELKLPSAIGARIKSESGLSSNDFLGYTKVGDYYQSANYDTAAKKIDITLKSGVSSLSVGSY